MQIYKFINFWVHLVLTSYNVHIFTFIHMISSGILTEKLINSLKFWVLWCSLIQAKEVSKVLSTRRSSRLIWVKYQEINKFQTALLLALSWVLSILPQGRNHSQGEGGENPFLVCKNIGHFEDLAYKNWSWPSKYMSQCNGALKNIYMFCTL